MEKLYVVYANGEVMRKGKAMLGSDNEAVVQGWKEALEIADDILGYHNNFYEVVPFVVDPPVKNYAEQGVPANPEDSTAGISNKGYAYACKHFGMNPMEVNKVRSSEQWAEIVELAKKHDIGVAEVENPHNFCEYINNPERPWSATIDSDNNCNLTPVKVSRSEGISEHTEEDELHLKLRKKIVNSSAIIPTKSVFGLYTETGEYHRDGKHVVFSNRRMANEYAIRVTPFLQDSVFVREKEVPKDEKVM